MDLSPQPSAVGVIPNNGLLLHVGVFKTGTTALQHALDHAGASLADAGVLYRGPSSWVPRSTNLLDLMIADEPGGSWRRLIDDISAHDGRAMVSSEILSTASPKQCAKVIKKLSQGRPVTVLVGVRPLSGLFASTWQQFLKRGYDQPFEEWLTRVFDSVGSADNKFWLRNDFPAQVRRWGRVVGVENVVVVMTDKSVPTRTPELVEDLLGLRRGTVVLDQSLATNPSMSFAQAELLRLVNAELVDRFSPDSYRRLIRMGVFPAMSRAATTSGEPIPLPRWAAEAAADIGRQQAEALATSGAVLVGDMGALANSRWDVDGPVPSPELIDMSSAAGAVAGAVLAGRRGKKRGDVTDAESRSTGRGLGAMLRRS